MKMGQGSGEKQPPIKVAEKDLHCYSCGGLIRKGSEYVRQDFVKLHYQRCPMGERVVSE
jgi:hypothetical protein